MELVRFRLAGEADARVGIHDAGSVRDITSHYPTLTSFLAAFPDGWLGREVVRNASAYPVGDVTLLPPLDPAATLYLVGANYRQHADEAGLSVPKTPVVFTKPANSLVGHNQAIRLPPISHEMDYEGELAVVIGRRAQRVRKEDAPRHVCGYTIVNDVTARDLQWVELGRNRIVDWFSSKSLEASSPVGPWIASAAPDIDPHRLHLTTELNGETMQNSDTSLMVFSVWDLIEYASARITLNPGDVISTGTPYGVGGFRKIFLKPGDRLRVSVERVGVLENSVENG